MGTCTSRDTHKQTCRLPTPSTLHHHSRTWATRSSTHPCTRATSHCKEKALFLLGSMSFLVCWGVVESFCQPASANRYSSIIAKPCTRTCVETLLDMCCMVW